MTRKELIENLIARAKRWHPSVRAKAQHARMPQVELDLWKAILSLIEYDSKPR